MIRVIPFNLPQVLARLAFAPLASGVFSGPKEIVPFNLARHYADRRRAESEA